MKTVTNEIKTDGRGAGFDQLFSDLAIFRLPI